MPEFIEQAFNQIAFRIQRIITFSLDDAVCPWRDDGLRIHGGYGFHDGVAVIPPVSQNGFCFHAVNQWQGRCVIGCLAGRQYEPQGIAKGISGSVDFCAQAAS